LIVAPDVRTSWPCDVRYCRRIAFRSTEKFPEVKLTEPPNGEDAGAVTGMQSAADRHASTDRPRSAEDGSVIHVVVPMAPTLLPFTRRCIQNAGGPEKCSCRSP